MLLLLLLLLLHTEVGIEGTLVIPVVFHVFGGRLSRQVVVVGVALVTVDSLPVVAVATVGKEVVGGLVGLVTVGV